MVAVTDRAKERLLEMKNLKERSTAWRPTRGASSSFSRRLVTADDSVTRDEAC